LLVLKAGYRLGFQRHQLVDYAGGVHPRSQPAY
jgi:hypothetical protein